MGDVMTKKFAQDILRALREEFSAHVFLSKTQKPFSTQVIRIDLSKSGVTQDNPYPVKLPFKSFYVQRASNPDIEFSIKIGDRDDVQSPVVCTLKDTWKTDLPVSEAYIHWEAQPSSWVEIVFFVDSEFSSGSQLNINAGGVSISSGSSMSARQVELVNGVDTNLLLVNAFRKKATLKNTSLEAIHLYNGVYDAAQAYEIEPGEVFEINNQGALKARPVGGVTARVSLIEEV